MSLKEHVFNCEKAIEAEAANDVERAPTEQLKKLYKDNELYLQALTTYKNFIKQIIDSRETYRPPKPKPYS